jgi:hypothetical protein
MEITSYNHHAKAPFFPASLILKPRLPGFESSLRSYPINPNVVVSDVRVEFHNHVPFGFSSTPFEIQAGVLPVTVSCPSTMLNFHVPWKRKTRR